METVAPEDKCLDVIVVGAGISGISSAYHILDRNPDASLKILEGRADVGGTWDLFQYPGLRSDSDMHTYGFSFNRWSGTNALASGAELKRYIKDTWKKCCLEERTEFQKRVTRAHWETERARWVLTVTDGNDGTNTKYETRFLVMATGYFEYERGYRPDFEGAEKFNGEIVHPQQWRDDLDYKDKRVVVIGSGATAVSLVPSIAGEANHVTLLQRSPTYMISRPREDRIAQRLKGVLPERLATWLHRWRYGLLTVLYFRYCRLFPDRSSASLIDSTIEAMGNKPIRSDVTPDYKPWDQRLCAVQDGDLFEQVKNGAASVVTGVIERMTESGIRLADGTELEADIIVTATGFNVQLHGGATLYVDDKETSLGGVIAYRDTLYSGVPNMAGTMGYYNGSWTLKAELQAELIGRIIHKMREQQWDICIPDAANVELNQSAYFTPGYAVRAAHLLPGSGTTAPWKSLQSFPLDIFRYRYGSIDHPALRFSRQR